MVNETRSGVNFDDQNEGEGREESFESTFDKTPGQAVSVLDSILAYENLDKPAEGKWRSVRLNTEFKFRALTNDEYDSLSRQYTEHRRLGRTQNVQAELNMGKFMPAVIETGSLDPDFDDPGVRRKLAERLGLGENYDSRSVLRKLLYPGELVDFGSAILALSGFGEEDEFIKALKGQS